MPPHLHWNHPRANIFQSKTYHTNSSATQEHNPETQYTGWPKSHQTHWHLKTYYWTLHYTPERRNPARPTRTPTQPTASIQKGHPKHSNINKMKRQRNTQQVKKQYKCPSNQTKEEEIGNLSDTEFQIMIVKMIQNLEVKMEWQINSLETRIEKMQERFNKDLEEIKKSQYIMNNK